MSVFQRLNKNINLSKLFFQQVVRSSNDIRRLLIVYADDIHSLRCLHVEYHDLHVNAQSWIRFNQLRGATRKGPANSQNNIIVASYVVHRVTLFHCRSADQREWVVADEQKTKRTWGRQKIARCCSNSNEFVISLIYRRSLIDRQFRRKYFGVSLSLSFASER